MLANGFAATVGLIVLGVMASGVIGWTVGYWQGCRERAEQIFVQRRLGILGPPPPPPHCSSAAWHADEPDPVVRIVRQFPPDLQCTARYTLADGPIGPGEGTAEQ